MEAAGFSEATIKTLKENGFEDVDDVSLLAGRGDEIVNLGLSLAQRLKLTKFVQQTGASSSTASPVSLEHILTDLQGKTEAGQSEQTAGDDVASGGSKPRGITDPLVYLRESSGGSKHKDIVDYIHLVTPVSEDHVISEGGDVQVLFRTAPRKPSLQNIAVEDWTLANTRIMDALYTQGELCGNAVRDYMAYTAKVCELFRRYERVSVLQYDREYRCLQAQFQFRWGTDAPHLHTVHLRSKVRGKPTEKDVEFAVPGHMTHGRQTQVCRLFNSAREGCTYGSSCKFLHVYSEPGCQESHPRRQHHTARPPSRGVAGESQ